VCEEEENMDEEDMNRILRQLQEQAPSLFEKWMLDNICIFCDKKNFL